MIAFYLDEHLPKNIAEAERLGLNAVWVSDRGTRGWSDESQLELAGADGRVFVTRNYPDFDALARKSVTDAQSHAGIVLVPSSLRQDDAIGLLRGLAEVAKLYPDGLAADTLMWLPRLWA